MVEVGVDFPASPLIFLLDCTPPDTDAGDFPSINFLASSNLFLRSSALATAFWAFVLAAVMSFSCFLFLASTLQATAADFFPYASFHLASFSAFLAAAAWVFVRGFPVRTGRAPGGANV